MKRIILFVAAAGLGVLGVPEWVLPALAQGETLVPFTDIPDNVRWDTPPDRRLLDVRTIDGPFTPPDKFAQLLDLNTVGALRVAQAVLPGMRARGHGRLLFMSSVAGRIVTLLGHAGGQVDGTAGRRDGVTGVARRRRLRKK